MTSESGLLVVTSDKCPECGSADVMSYERADGSTQSSCRTCDYCWITVAERH